MIQNVILVGAGNLATRLGIALSNAGIKILQVYSRTIDSAQVLANQFNAEYTNKIENILSNADLYIFSVKDDAIIHTLETFPYRNKMIVHTAGSLSINILANYSDKYGVFYPLQTFSKHREIDFKNIPICIEAINQQVNEELTTLAQKLSNNIYNINSTQRQSLHLAAVFVCNFVNYMYHIGYNIVQNNDLKFDILKPLIKETAFKVMNSHPKDVQTGPAVRYDEKIINKHMNFLKNQTNLQKLYSSISKQISNIHTLNNMTFIKDKLLKIKALIFDVDGVLSEDTSPLGEDGVPIRTTNVKDGFAIRNAVNMGYKVAIITGGNAERVKLRYEKVGVQHIYMAVGNKVEILEKFAREENLKMDEILYMGDDLIDIKIMEMVGFPCCPSDACHEVKEISIYISDKVGGKACVRDVIEQVMRAQETWLNKNAYSWRST